jgi:hypothetical protein
LAAVARPAASPLLFTGTHDHDRLVAAAIGEAGHLAMARRDPPLPAAIEDRVRGDQGAVFEFNGIGGNLSTKFGDINTSLK